tara:strand:+ start:236 stop:463 length:228 start_codon:yes stop_codon:yes gene_type:complete
MADKFTKTEEPAGVGDDWKDVSVTKEHQPAKVTSNLRYRDMENQLKDITKNISRLETEKTDLEAEMVKVKAAFDA